MFPPALPHALGLLYRLLLLVFVFVARPPARGVSSRHSACRCVGVGLPIALWGVGRRLCPNAIMLHALQLELSKENLSIQRTRPIGRETPGPVARTPLLFFYQFTVIFGVNP